MAMTSTTAEVTQSNMMQRVASHSASQLTQQPSTLTGLALMQPGPQVTTHAGASTRTQTGGMKGVILLGR